MSYIKKFKGILSSFLLLGFISAFFGVFASECRVSAAFIPDVDKIYSEGVYMVNLDTNVVVYSKNENTRYYPASITKIMTAVVILENCPDINAKVRIGSDAFNEFWGTDKNKHNVSNVALEAGQTNISYRDCLYGLMVSSGCEAANILALNLCGSIEDFVAMMNNKAKEIGCLDTHFGNAHGLWQEDNYTTPYDMYLITRYAYDHVPKFMDISDAHSYDFPGNKNNPDGYTKYNTNPLISASSEYYLDYVHGVKTGSIDEYYDKDGNTHPGGRCLVTTAQKDGLSYILVTMQAPFYSETGESINYAAKDHYNLYEWAYKSFVYQTVVSENEVCTEAKVEQGENDRVQLITRNQFATLVPKNLSNNKDNENGSGENQENPENSGGESTVSPVQKKISLLYDKILAPVKKGEVLGKLEVIYQGELVQTIDLIAAKSVERSQVAYITDRAKALTDTSWFKPLLLLLALCLIVQFILLTVRRRILIQEARRMERRRKRNSYK